MKKEGLTGQVGVVAGATRGAGRGIGRARCEAEGTRQEGAFVSSGSISG
jgi:hypothetical protein